MGNYIGSIYDGDKITVSEMIGDPTFIPERITESLDGAFLENLLFRDGGTNEGVVAFRESAAPYLNDDAENVAEFAEIPITDLNTGRLRSAFAIKTALGVRASYEMINFNKLDLLTKQIDALQKTFIRTSVKASLAAFDAANVPEVTAKTAWTAETAADPAYDVFEAIDAITAATVDGETDEYFDFVPDVLVAHPRVINALFRAEKVQDKYIGDAAADNPLFAGYRGVRPETAFGLRLVESRYLDPTEAIIMEAGAAGFHSDTIPFQVSGFYNEGAPADVSTMGPFMSRRCDAVHKRAVAVDNPKAVIRIKGVTA